MACLLDCFRARDNRSTSKIVSHSSLANSRSLQVKSCHRSFVNGDEPDVQLFSSSQGSGLGLGFIGSPEPALPPPPPPVEVLSSKASSSVDDGETDKKGGYDIILMAETIYSISAQNYELIKRCMGYPDGAVYMAAKNYYFRVGGGTRQFLSMIDKDGVLASTLVSEVTDGSSNVRKIWKLSYK